MKHTKALLTLLCLSLIFSLSIPVSANSAQTEWTGRTESGVVTTDEDCPIVIEHETLTFDLQEFPKYDYTSYDDFASYTGRVTAEYTFYNPSDMEVTARLAFPIETDYTYPHSYTDYEITVNGDIDGEIYVAGAKLEQGKLLSAGGRVLGVVAKGDDLKQAIAKAYQNTTKVHFDNAFYRKDIGKRALEVYNNK